MRSWGRVAKRTRLVAFGLLTAVPLALTHTPVVDGVVAAENITDTASLFAFETVQLTDRVIANLSSHQLSDISLFSFRINASSAAKKRQSRKCKTYPGDAGWPSERIWKLFDALLGGALIKTVPDAAVCYRDWSVFDALQCQTLTDNWGNSSVRIEDPTAIRSILYQGMTCMPPNMTASFLGNGPNCTVGGFPEYTVKATNVAQIQLAVNFARELDLRLIIKNTGHDFGGKSVGKGALSIWTHHLKDAIFYERYTTGSYSGPAFKFGAGIQVFEANKLAKEYGVSVVGGEGKTVGHVGGYTQGGGHSPLTSLWGMAADQVLSLEIVTADGRFITADSEANPDIFWAVRGGGGSTYGVVTSMVVKAHPKIKVTTMRYNITTDANFTHDKFWAAQRAYIDNFAQYADLGYYSYFRIRHSGDEIFHDMTSWVAPNTSEVEFRTNLAPLFKKWAALGVPFRPIIREYDNYHDAWADGFPQEPWLVTMRQASRFFPRENLVDEEKKNATVDAIRGVFDEGASLIMFNIRNPPDSDKIDNAVNPAWRKVLMFAIMFTTWNTTSSQEVATNLSRKLTFEWNPRWIELTPGSGTYMSESDYIEPNWQQSFYGSNYARLYRLKQEWDPDGVFYAQNAVGMEDWEMSEMILGHLPSQNSKLCRK
ncbi:FAD binding domain-containing protein [Zopfia rhizophila CBS 207.26]|uniref:FAD binding domain-containing protein n=1 Tax=Zopfia rhizophila CBS 207.26 TaxID=1314779 RepID=A0A6A6E7E1_9PEZI|nr:FAD binding domain-containing protein [Zopfia rhizophila CBS 207.26]